MPRPRRSCIDWPVLGRIHHLRHHGRSSPRNNHIIVCLTCEVIDALPSLTQHGSMTTFWSRVMEHTSLGAINPRRWLVLAVVVAAQFMYVVDTFIVNVAIPSIRAD